MGTGIGSHAFFQKLFKVWFLSKILGYVAFVTLGTAILLSPVEYRGYEILFLASLVPLGLIVAFGIYIVDRIKYGF